MMDLQVRQAVASEACNISEVAIASASGQVICAETLSNPKYWRE